MKVKELIAWLFKENQEREVVLSMDAEGNGYSSLRAICTGAYDANDGEVGLEKLTEEDIKDGYGEDDVIEDGLPAIILCP